MTAVLLCCSTIGIGIIGFATQRILRSDIYILDTVMPFSLSKFCCVSGGPCWFLLILIVQNPTWFIDLTSYLVLCVFLLLHVSYSVNK